MGEQNVFRGKVMHGANGVARVATDVGEFTGANRDGLSAGDDAMIFVRPERLDLASRSNETANRMRAHVERRDLEGPFVNVFLRAAGNLPLVMHITNSGDDWRALDGELEVGFRSKDALVLRAGELARE